MKKILGLTGKMPIVKTKGGIKMSGMDKKAFCGSAKALKAALK